MQFPCDNCKITNINNISNKIDVCENCTLIDEYNRLEEKKLRNKKFKKIRRPVIETKLQEIL